jgi:hypothetical protein
METSNGSDTQKTIDDHVERALSDETIQEPIPMTFKRLQALAALLALSAVAILPLFLISGGLSMFLWFVELTVAYTVEDIGGNGSHTWLGIVNCLAVAAVSPVAGAVSDLVGRRYIGLSGVLLIIAGMIVVGTAHTMSIGGMALAGVGSGLAQTVGVAGACEMVPVKHRGAYLGTIYLVFTPMAPASAYGILLQLKWANCSAIVLYNGYLEMGCLDSSRSCWSCVRYGSYSVSSTSSCHFCRSRKEVCSFTNRLCWIIFVDNWIGFVPHRSSIWRI